MTRLVLLSVTETPRSGFATTVVLADAASCDGVLVFVPSRVPIVPKATVLVSDSTPAAVVVPAVAITV